MDINDGIEILKNSKKLYLKEKIDSDILEDAISTALDFMKKQQKEIEELKEFKKQVEEIESTNFIKYKNYISKDKIKAKIEEVNAEELNLAFIISGVEYKEAITSALQSLLEKE